MPILISNREIIADLTIGSHWVLILVTGVRFP